MSGLLSGLALCVHSLCGAGPAAPLPCPTPGQAARQAATGQQRSQAALRRPPPHATSDALLGGPSTCLVLPHPSSPQVPVPGGPARPARAPGGALGQRLGLHAVSRPRSLHQQHRAHVCRHARQVSVLAAGAGGWAIRVLAGVAAACPTMSQAGRSLCESKSCRQACTPMRLLTSNRLDALAPCPPLLPNTGSRCGGAACLGRTSLWGLC